MKQEPLFITFNGHWFPEEDSVDELLKKLDMGESIPISKFKEACKKEGKKFEIKLV